MGLYANNGFTFPQKINSRGFFERTSNLQLLIRASILQILCTYVGERAMEVEFGSRVKELLFEPLDEIAIALGRVYTIEAIERWEPRVQLNDVGARINPDQGTLEIYGSYVIVNKKVDDEFLIAIPRNRGIQA